MLVKVSIYLYYLGNLERVEGMRNAYNYRSLIIACYLRERMLVLLRNWFEREQLFDTPVKVRSMRERAQRNLSLYRKQGVQKKTVA